MAKKKKKDAKKDRKDRKKQRRAVAGNALLGTFAGGVVGKVAERLIVNEIDALIHPLRHKRAKEKAHANGQEDDVAGRLLTVLADGGSKPVPQLLVETQLGLSKLLHALQTLRDFRLVNFVGEPGEETVEVTCSGAHTVTALRKNHIHEEAAKLLTS